MLILGLRQVEQDRDGWKGKFEQVEKEMDAWKSKYQEQQIILQNIESFQKAAEIQVFIFHGRWSKEQGN